MDDAAGPLDTLGEPVSSDAPETEAEGNTNDDPGAGYAPPSHEESAQRLDLDGDPFVPEPAYPVLDPEPLVPAIDAPPDLGQPDAEAEAPQAPSEVADLSLEDMVDELRTDEQPLEEPEPAEAEITPDGAEFVETDTAPEDAEDVEQEDAPDGDEPAEPSGWRDVVAATPDVIAPVLARRRLSARLPFWIYGGLWAAFVGTLTYLMWPLSDKPFVGSMYYAYMVFGGVGMIAIGLVLGIIVWAAVRAGTAKPERDGLVRAICLRAAGWTTIGVVLWWAGMYALDLHRTGAIG